MRSLPEKENLGVEYLAAAFQNTSASYKFYWLLAILEEVKAGKQCITVLDLLSRMVALSWYPISYFKLSFGKSDSLSSIIQNIQMNSDIAEKDKADVVYEKLKKILSAKEEKRKSSKTIKKEVKKLSLNVPFRFLSPFFKNELKGVKRDADKHLRIIELAETNFHKHRGPSIYRFLNNKKVIEIQPDWLCYLHNNLRMIEDFCKWNLLLFLQKRNPHTPNVAHKLFAEGSPGRSLQGKPRDFWNIVFENETSINCIFSKKAILKTEDFALDHFLPFSFVAHNEIWNLNPILQQVNSSKSNNIPNIKLYLDTFSEQQFNAFQTVYDRRKYGLLEDYSMLFKEHADYISKYSKRTFRNKLYEHIVPLSQIAKNMGFSSGWKY